MKRIVLSLMTGLCVLAPVHRVGGDEPGTQQANEFRLLRAEIDAAQVTGAKAFSNACHNALRLDKKCAIQILRMAPLPREKGHRWVLKRLVVIPSPWAEVKAAGEACPIKLIGAVIRANSIGQPEVWLSVQNVSTQDAVAFEVAIDCFDRFDRPVPIRSVLGCRWLGLRGGKPRLPCDIPAGR